MRDGERGEGKEGDGGECSTLFYLYQTRCMGECESHVAVCVCVCVCVCGWVVGGCLCWSVSVRLVHVFVYLISIGCPPCYTCQYVSMLLPC